jgi:hypothetical protein
VATTATPRCWAPRDDSASPTTARTRRQALGVMTAQDFQIRPAPVRGHAIITQQDIDAVCARVVTGDTVAEACRQLDPSVDAIRRYVTTGSERERARRQAAAAALRGRWTRDSVLAAIREWARRYGEPPAATDWNPALARRQGRQERAERHGGGDWPYYSTVVRLCGGWNAAITAAGFTARPQGHA